MNSLNVLLIIILLILPFLRLLYLDKKHPSYDFIYNNQDQDWEVWAIYIFKKNIKIYKGNYIQVYNEYKKLIK